MKKFLAIDCAGEELLVGCFNGKKYQELRLLASGTENLLPTIDSVLKKSKMKILDVDVVCVGVGPGSWTGARVAVVTAYGLFEGNKNLKFCTFNSFDLISYNGARADKVLKLVKAYANFVYVQTPEGGIKAITKDELQTDYSKFEFVGINEIVPGMTVVSSDLEAIATKKVLEEVFVEVDSIEPMYLRLSQAEYQREKMLKGGK